MSTVGLHKQFELRTTKPCLSSVPKFIILALPRSRTAWLTHYLSYGGRSVGHDIAITCRRPRDFVLKLESLAGTVETGAVDEWKVLRKFLPDARIVVVKRPLEEVIGSLEKCGVLAPVDQLQRRRACLDEVSALPGVATIQARDLDYDLPCKWLFEYCLGEPWDREWAQQVKMTNIQVDMPSRLVSLVENQAGIAALRQACSGQVQYAQEPWAGICDEVLPLAERHAKEVDEGVEPRRPFNLDADLMQAMCQAGALKIFTARIYGELVGYFTWQVSLDVESKGLLIAQQGAWFVLPGVGKANVGYKLFTFSVAELKKLGVKHVFPHHRLQGRGVELGKFFRRVGAKEIQHTYSLWIGD